MPWTSKSIAANCCRRNLPEPVLKTSDDIFTIHDVTAGGWFDAKTAINLADRKITKTWNAAGLTWRRSYFLDDYTTVETDDSSRLMEGYSLPLFVVSLSGKGHRLKIFSTDNSEDADSVRNRLSDILIKHIDKQAASGLF